ncbi:GNAT family N-acetyltransferase [Lutibacter sp. B2]|nr:GNAT family N-acetyltransferase [Lutibacter sp. B2]
MNIYFERCKEEQFDLLYELKSEEENILWTGHDKAPDRKKLKVWYFNQLKREDRYMFIIKSREYAGEPIGYLYLDVVGDLKNIIETGHGVNNKFKGQGIGTRIIKFAIDYTTEYLTFIDRIDGWIVENNIGSIKNVINNGYIKTKETKKVVFKGLNREVLMEKYCYKINRNDE